MINPCRFGDTACNSEQTVTFMISLMINDDIRRLGYDEGHEQLHEDPEHVPAQEFGEAIGQVLFSWHLLQDADRQVSQLVDPVCSQVDVLHLASSTRSLHLANGCCSIHEHDDDPPHLDAEFFSHISQVLRSLHCIGCCMQLCFSRCCGDVEGAELLLV